VTDITTVEEPHVIGGPALRIGIFLSVFDVHVNRAPLDGRITRVRYTEGKFLDARHPDAGTANEANLVGFEGPFGPFAVRQVAGFIARRIVFPLAEGATVARGQRIGMIKFGSRTELFVPASAPVQVEVAVGQRVRGGDTILLRYRR
jgi:phosphatidylserine decarboxylase